MQRVVVIGAGPAGMACAARYTEHGGTPVVYEASAYVGGLARSFELWGSSVDLGPHRFFSSDPVVNEYWHRHVRGDYVMVPRQTRIYYRRRFFDYPLRPQNALRNLGPVRAVAALASYLRVRLAPPRQDGSLERWVAQRFGWRLYRTFFQTYTEKVWGIPCTAIDADWAAQRIQGLTLWKAVRNALAGGRRNSLKTLVDEFAYPTRGNGVFYQRQREAIVAGGGEVHTSTPVARVVVEHSRVVGVELADGTRTAADVVVSSMPITLLVKGLDGVPERVVAAANQLRFRNTILVYLRVTRREVFTDQWLYIHDPGLAHGRITNFNNWSAAMMGPAAQTILCLEFWCFDMDAIWSETDTQLVDRARSELGRTGLVAEDAAAEGHVVRIPRSYPVYERGYQAPLKIVTDHLDTIEGLVAVGRYGSFKYNNQDHSILMGLLAADAIARGERPDLWAINTESTYQEAAESRVLSRGA
jgi:protoporphyrinogen oxidase